MDGPPSTPPRRTVVQRAGAHLHKRTASRTIPIMLSPPTPPHGGPHAAALRIIPESPSATRVMSPPSKRTAISQPQWMQERGGTSKSRSAWTPRRLALLASLIVALLLVVRHRSTASWDRDGDEEQATYGRANAVQDVMPSLRAATADPPPEPTRVFLHPVIPPPRAPGADPHPQQVPNSDRFRKVAGAKAGVATDDAAPIHNLELTSATDPDSTRRFILVGWMGEQETKAQLHLYQLGLLALALNRTLVLPNVKRSRFGTCYHNPFSLYYAEDTLSRFNIPYITSDDFYSWTDRQRTPPTAQTLSFVRGPAVPAETIALSARKMCLVDRSLDFDQFEPKAFFSPQSDWKSATVREQFGVDVVQQLLAQEPPASGAVSEDLRTPAVLIAQYNLRYPFLSPEVVASVSPFDFPLPHPYAYFDYSSHWTALGETMAASLSPFVAVHWRTETLSPTLLEPCGSALISALRDIQRVHPEIKTVYLATDYPIEVLRQPGDEGKITAHSGTMTKTLTPAHHVAMRNFLAKLEGEGDSMRITTFMEEQSRVKLPPALQEMVGSGGLEGVDGAIVGIVDKIVLMSAQVFYAGLPVSDSSRGCAKLSQFTTQVITGRQDLRAQEGSEAALKLWNDVDHFSLAKTPKVA
ncbi:uncharacterized protein JCM10292_005730 [Rhodotorula paludigena]|uniref:uncharacterized protein n=1 Tax=Rhodotorula paludigena TaxID=86838 RepID=UPI003171B905